MSSTMEEIELEKQTNGRRDSESESDDGFASISSSNLRSGLLSSYTTTRASTPDRLAENTKFQTASTYILRNLRTSLLPSWLHRASWSDNSKTTSPPQLSKTAWLDGLRGTAAFCVFVYHFMYAYYGTAEYGYGSGSANHYIFQLPILRIWLSGPSMVATFFVISGYALSYKALTQIRRKQHASVLSTVSSSTFRRAMRLFIPTWVSVFCIACFIQMGLFTWSVKHAPKKEFPGWREDNPPIHSSFWKQMADLPKVCFKMVNPFRWEEYWVTYDLHLWTIPDEFRCSLVVFLALVGLARVKSLVRMALLTCLAALSMGYYHRWDVALFLSGMVVCEINLISDSHDNTSSLSSEAILSAPPSKPRRSILRFILVAAIFLAGMYLCSIPRLDPNKTPGYRTLYKLIPKSVGAKDRFWTGIGAVLIVFSVSFSSILKWPFETRFVQYLGKISYSLYLVHGSICRAIGWYVVINVWKHTGKNSFVGKRQAYYADLLSCFH